MTGTSGHRKPHIFYVGILVLITLCMSLPGIATMQVIDRDEARYAQATVQMVESGDYLNIRFQDRARNKKPAGIYWLQAGSVKVFTNSGDRKIWAHRLISVLGALLAVLSTYWGALAVIGRRGAFWSGAILATTLLLTFEAHIAKTDAMLCGLSALCLACLIRLQRQNHVRTAFLFWIGLASAIMIKGPITPAIIILALVTYAIWQRDVAWMRRLINVPAIVIGFFIVVPWAVAIGLETNGAFFKDSIGGDMGSKIVSGQESHGAWPGYYSLTLSIFFWPGILLLVPGIALAMKIAKQKKGDEPLKQSMCLLLCWVLPFFLILELVPTKLPNYPLPLYPALSIFCGGALLALLGDNLKRSRRIGAFLFLLVGIIAIIAIFAVDSLYSEIASPVFFLFPLLIILAFVSSYFVWRGEIQNGIIGALLLTGFLSPLTYAHIFPRLSELRLSDRIEKKLNDNEINPNRVLSPNFTEPSLVYALGTDILLGDKADAALDNGLLIGDVIIIDEIEAETRHETMQINSKIRDKDNCLREFGRIEGTNYSKGDPVHIKLYVVRSCKPA